MTKTVNFNRITYALAPFVGAAANIAFIGGQSDRTLTGPQLLDLYNLVSANLGKGRVKRFADRKAAEKRTWAILEEYDAAFTDAAGEPPAGRSETEAKQKAAAKPKAQAAQLSKEDKAQVKAEAKDRKASASTAAGERWRTPKRREPSKRCYMPRPGSKQDVAYQLLTQEGGIRVEDLCKKMAALDKSGKNTTEWKEPGTIWGSLNYLFVTQKGYGLEFDGERIRLLKGKEEIPFNNGKKD